MCNGLVLGGGGSKGAYQIGVLRALNELGYNYFSVFVYDQVSWKFFYFLPFI